MWEVVGQEGRGSKVKTRDREQERGSEGGRERHGV